MDIITTNPLQRMFPVAYPDGYKASKWRVCVSRHDDAMFDDAAVFAGTQRCLDALCGSDGMFGRNAASLFAAARDEALRSVYDGPHLGCVIACKGRILARGRNQSKTSPLQKEYDMRYRDFVSGLGACDKEHSLHAEMSAITELRRSGAYPKRGRLVAYVYRVAPGLPLRQGQAKPCPACMHALADAGVEAVCYSTDDGFAMSFL